MEGWAAEAKPNSASVCHGPDAGVGLSASRSGQGFNSKNLLRHGSWRDRGNLRLQLQLHCSSQPTNTFAAGKIGFVGWSPPSPLLNPYRRQELVGGADPVVCPSRQPYRSSALRKATDHVACRQTAALSKCLSRDIDAHRRARAGYRYCQVQYPAIARIVNWQEQSRGHCAAIHRSPAIAICDPMPSKGGYASFNTVSVSGTKDRQLLLGRDQQPFGACIGPLAPRNLVLGPRGAVQSVEVEGLYKNGGGLMSLPFQRQNVDTVDVHHVPRRIRSSSDTGFGMVFINVSTISTAMERSQLRDVARPIQPSADQTGAMRSRSLAANIIIWSERTRIAPGTMALSDTSRTISNGYAAPMEARTSPMPRMMRGRLERDPGPEHGTTQHTNTTPRDDASSSCTAASRPRPTPPAAAVAASSAPEPAVRPRELPAHAALQPPPPAAFDSCPACLPGPQPLPDRPAPRPRHDSTQLALPPDVQPSFAHLAARGLRAVHLHRVWKLRYVVVPAAVACRAAGPVSPRLQSPVPLVLTPRGRPPSACPANPPPSSSLVGAWRPLHVAAAAPVLRRDVENAVELLSNPTSNQSLKEQAFEFLSELRSNPQGWQACTNLFARTPRPSEVVRMVCLEVVNYAVHTQGLDGESLAYLKYTLLQYVRQGYGPEAQQEPDPVSLQNKLTQTLTYLFVFLYQNGWQSFLDDFWELTGVPSNASNSPGVLLYLRILSSIHDEIADMLLARESNEAKRNTELKDQLRAQDMHKVADSWKQLLVRYADNDTVVELVLKVVGKWVSWMDISLVVSQDMLNLLLPVVGRTNHGTEDKVRDTAIDTLTEICGKKMRSADKMEMVSFLSLEQIVGQLIASPSLTELKGTPKYDTDLAEAVAKLVNTVMSDIVKALDDSQSNEETRERAKQHLNGFLPFLLRLFSDDYDEVCSTVIPALTDLLTFLRKLGQLPPEYSRMLAPILDAIIRKMRFDETSSWGNEDEQTDEAEFQELRRKLQNLQKTIAAIDQPLYMDMLSNLVATTFQSLDQRGSDMDWRDLDLALYEMYLFGELALPNQGLGTKNQPSSEASERLVVMMQKMVGSGIASFSHPAILLQYMEICVRYCAIFESHPEYIPQVLENFVRLVHHDHVRIKTRSWYLFHRFIKQLRSRVGNVAETVIQSIGDLLPIKAEVPGDDADDDMSSDESDHSADALFTSQLYLFEAIGCISSTQSTPADKQALYARSVMDPLFQDMEVHLQRAKSGDAQAVLQIHHIVMALGTLAHGFSDWTPGSASSHHPPPEKAVSDEFSRAAEAILIALNQLNSSAEIRTACRSSFSKLLGVLGSAVLPQLPQWIEGLLSQSSSKDEMAMFLRLLDQVVFGFKSEIYEVLNVLLTPLLQRIFGGLSEPIAGTDDEIQLAELRREYLSFLQIILNNGLDGVLISEANQGFFEPMIASITELAKSIEGNIGPSRLAFTLMARISAIWGGPDVATISQNPTAPSGTPTPAIPGFDRFMIERFHTVCWEVMRNPSFRPSQDAQTKQVLTEIANLEQTIYSKTGDMFIQELQNGLFPSLGIDGGEFLRSLTTSTDKKGFASYLQGLLKNRH
ncbi:hypothetical protein Purlil1_10613 [Purpureocillium lilacinum]|uniref:Exportin-T n=1 Tax=Purpureocillium lilacinum TaxID=33203 RepID=A0ABR0BM64_PURLI|nr:hypothetical protein Purlil1_10613 [Purpureocillium lilacinum]